MDIKTFKKRVLNPDFDENTLNSREKGLYNRLMLQYRRSNFKAFCKAVFPEIKWMWFQELIMDEIQKAINTPYARLIVEMPPQHGKTTLITHLLSAFYLGRYPDRKVVNGTYNSDRAGENTQGVKTILGMETYKAIFPTRIKSTDEDEAIRNKKKMKNKKDSVRRFSLLNSESGEFKAVGIGEGLTGYSADLETVDDYHKDYEEAASQVERDKVWNWFTSVLLTRGQSHGTPVLICATRWHDDDLIGRLKRYQRMHKDNPHLSKWRIITIPAERDQEDFEARPYDPRPIGELLWAEKAPLCWEIKTYQSRVWQCLFQQRPPTEEGVIIQRHWLRPYRYLPENLDRIVISVDTSFNARAKQSDDCAIEVWGMKGMDFYLMKFIARRMGYVETKEVVSGLIKEYPDYAAVLVELKANGAALIEDLKINYSRVIEYDPLSKTKRQRLEAVTPLFEASRIYLPNEDACPEIHVFVEQLLQFTGLDPTEKDDLVDSMTQALWYMDKFNLSISANSFLTCKRMTSYQLAVKMNGGRSSALGQKRFEGIRRTKHLH